MVTIIGAGLAGLSAAIALAERGIPSNLVSQQPSERPVQQQLSQQPSDLYVSEGFRAAA